MDAGAWVLGKSSMGQWFLAALVIQGCAPVLTGTRPLPGTSEAAGVLWRPPTELALPGREKLPGPTLPKGVSIEALKADGAEITLDLVLDVALANNPMTREAWEAAKEAAANFGGARSEWFPQLTLDAQVVHMSQAAVGGRFEFQITQATAAIGLSWLLFDFGGRGARIDAARYALIAADFRHNQAIRDLRYQVEQTFVQFVNAQALVRAQQQSVDAARTSLEAAQARQEAGVGTLADALQARTAVSEARLAQTRFEGQVQSLEGALATAMGLPATLGLSVRATLPEPPVVDVHRSVEPLVQKALEARPELSSLRAQVASSEAQARAREKAFWPRILANGSFTPTWFFDPPGGGRHYVNNYTYGLGVQVPLFVGFQTGYDARAAEANVRSLVAQAETLADQVTLDVWSAWVELRTAAVQVENARDLLTSAEAAYEVANGQYREGVGNILDLLNAQSALAKARATSVQARSGWYLAYAALAHAMGGEEWLPVENAQRLGHPQEDR